MLKDSSKAINWFGLLFTLLNLPKRVRGRNKEQRIIANEKKNSHSLFIMRSLCSIRAGCREFHKNLAHTHITQYGSEFDSTVKWKFYLTFIDRPIRMVTNTYLTYVLCLYATTFPDKNIKHIREICCRCCWSIQSGKRFYVANKILGNIFTSSQQRKKSFL